MNGQTKIPHQILKVDGEEVVVFENAQQRQIRNDGNRDEGFFPFLIGGFLDLVRAQVIDDRRDEYQ